MPVPVGYRRGNDGLCLDMLVNQNSYIRDFMSHFTHESLRLPYLLNHCYFRVITAVSLGDFGEIGK
jgi:hypothetical protein